ncbi:MAG: hypothetical protein ACKV2T_39005 [Kofleriaceae bacterium]
MQFVTLALVVTVGCYDPRPVAGVPCVSECPGDQSCIEGVCRDPGYVGDAAIDSEPADAPIDGDPNVDTDSDGHFDDEDNCIAVANANQHDEDSDDLGDVCDPCPHVAIGGAADGDTDGVGDACDPEPARAEQRWLVFDPLLTRAAEWNVFGGVTFGVDSMTLDSGGLRYVRPFSNFRVQIAGDLTILDPAADYQMVVEVSSADNTHNYYGEVYGDDSNGGDLKLTRRDGNIYPIVDIESYTTLPQGAFAWTLDTSVANQTLGLQARHGTTQFPALQGTGLSGSPIIASPYVQLATEKIRLRVDYFAIIETID